MADDIKKLDEQKDLMELFAGLLAKNNEILDSVNEKIDVDASLQALIADSGKRSADSLDAMKGSGTPSFKSENVSKKSDGGIFEQLTKIVSILQAFLSGTGTGAGATATPGPSTTKKDKPQILMLPAPPGTTGGQLVPLGSPISPAKPPRGGPLALPPPIPGTGTQMSTTDKMGTLLSMIAQRLETQQGTTSKMYQGMQAMSKTEFAKTLGMDKPLEKGMLALRASAGDPTAIAQLGKEQAQKFKEGIKEGFGGLWKGFHSERGSQVLGEGMGGMAKLAKYVSPVAAGFLALGGIAFKLVDKLRMWGENLHNANMKWAEFSSGMSQVQAEQEVRDIQYSQARGQARAATARETAEAHSRLRESFAPVEDAFANIRNRIFSGLARIVSFGLETHPLMRGIAWLNERIGGGDAEESQRVFGDVRWLNDVPSDDDWMQRFNRPARFGEVPGLSLNRPQ